MNQESTALPEQNPSEPVENTSANASAETSVQAAPTLPQTTEETPVQAQTNLAAGQPQYAQPQAYPQGNYPAPQPGQMPVYPGYPNEIVPPTPARLLPKTIYKVLAIIGLWGAFIAVFATWISKFIENNMQQEIENYKAAGLMIDQAKYEDALFKLQAGFSLGSAIALLIAFLLVALFFWLVIKVCKPTHPVSYGEALLWSLLISVPTIVVFVISTISGQYDLIIKSAVLSIGASIISVGILVALLLKVAKAKTTPVMVLAGIILGLNILGSLVTLMS